MQSEESVQSTDGKCREKAGPKPAAESCCIPFIGLVVRAYDAYCLSSLRLRTLNIRAESRSTGLQFLSVSFFSSPQGDIQTSHHVRVDVTVTRRFKLKTRMLAA